MQNFYLQNNETKNIFYFVV